MSNNSVSLEKEYHKWLTKEYSFKDLDDDVVRIDTPFLDSTFDNIVLYVEYLKDGSLNITDDGWTIDNLESVGLSFNKRTKNRNNILKNIITNFGVSLDDENGELFIKTDMDNFSDSKLRLLQAILKINDIIYLSTNNVKNEFNELVASFLNEHKIFASKDIAIQAEYGLTYNFQFAIPGIEKKEKLIRTISSPNNINYIKVMSFDSEIVSRTRNADFIAILNDEKPIKQLSAIKGLENSADFSLSFTPYSKIEENPEILIPA